MVFEEEEDEITDIREQIFHNSVREQVVSVKTPTKYPKHLFLFIITPNFHLIPPIVIIFLLSSSHKYLGQVELDKKGIVWIINSAFRVPVSKYED